MNKEKKIYEFFEEFDFSEEFEEEVERVYTDENLNFETRKKAEEYVETYFAENTFVSNISNDCETTYNTDIQLDENFEYLKRGIFKVRFFTNDLNIFINFLRKRRNNTWFWNFRKKKK